MGRLWPDTVVLAGLALAEAPKPAPETQKLGYFVGKWKGEGQVKENPFMPQGKMTWTETCEWFEGGFAVVCRSEGNGPSGANKGLGIMSYSVEEQAYTWYGLDSLGMVMSTVPKGSVEGDVWTFTDESKMGGQMVKARFVIEQRSPTEQSFKWEMLGPDGKWMTLMDGKSTKA